MSNDTPQNPLLSKMEALIQKHRGPAGVTPEPTPPPGWLPVLTEVIVRGTPPNLAPATSAQPVAEPDVEKTTASMELPNTDQLADQLLNELGPKLSAVMEKQVAAELRKNLDETVASLLSQLDVNVRDIVRDAVAEKLKAQKPDS